MNLPMSLAHLWNESAWRFAFPMLSQSSALILLFFALNRLMRGRVRATWLYAMWMLALIKLASPPSLSLPTGVVR